MNTRLVMFLVPLVIISSTAFSSEPGSEREKRDYRFERIWLEEGLSQSSVRVLYQDSRGFVESVTDFSGSKPRDDDMTLIVIKVNGGKPLTSEEPPLARRHNKLKSA